MLLMVEFHRLSDWITIGVPFAVLMVFIWLMIDLMMKMK